MPGEILDNNSGQDIAAWYTRGAIADRTRKNLGRSDKGIILFRRQLEENLKRVERGEDPMNVFRDPAQNVFHDFPTETVLKVGTAGARRQRGGFGPRLF